MGKRLYLKGKIIHDEGDKYFGSPTFFMVASSGITYRNKDYFVTIKRPERTLIEYIVDGKGFIECEGKIYNVEKGHTVIIRSNVKVTYYADNDDPYVKLWFTVVGDFAESVLALTMGEKKVVTAKKNSYDIIEKLHKAIEKNGTDPQRDSHAFLDILYLLYPPNKTDDNSKNKTESTDFVDKIRDYFDLFYRDAITVEATAEHFHVSQRYLIEQFKRRFNTTPHRYIMQKRMEGARELLSGTDFTVGEISDILGFCEPGYFTKAFTREYGMSPKSFRLENKGK